MAIPLKNFEVYWRKICHLCVEGSNRVIELLLYRLLQCETNLCDNNYMMITWKFILNNSVCHCPVQHPFLGWGLSFSLSRLCKLYFRSGFVMTLLWVCAQQTSFSSLFSGHFTNLSYPYGSASQPVCRGTQVCHERGKSIHGRMLEIKSWKRSIS